MKNDANGCRFGVERDRISFRWRQEIKFKFTSTSGLLKSHAAWNQWKHGTRALHVVWQPPARVLSRRVPKDLFNFGAPFRATKPGKQLA